LITEIEACLHDTLNDCFFAAVKTVFYAVKCLLFFSEYATQVLNISAGLGKRKPKAKERQRILANVRMK